MSLRDGSRGGALIWSLAAVAGIYRFSLLRLPETSGSFPFSFKQFLVMGLALCSAAGLYFASFAVACGLVNALQSSLSSMLPSYTSQEWTALSQIVGMALGLASMVLIRGFLPNDALSTVVGGGAGIGKALKGAAVGVLVCPVILFVAWIVSAAVSVFSTEPKVSPTVLGALFADPSLRGHVLGDGWRGCFRGSLCRGDAFSGIFAGLFQRIDPPLPVRPCDSRSLLRASLFGPSEREVTTK